MIGLTSLLLAVTLAQGGIENLAGTATLIAPATCVISAKAAPDVTVRIDPKNGWVAEAPGVVGHLRLVIDSGLPGYGYNGGFPVQGVPISNGADTSYTFTFKAPILSIRTSGGPPPGKIVEPGGRTFALTQEEHGSLVLDLIVPNVAGNSTSGIHPNVTRAGQSGTGVYRIRSCTFEP